MSSVIGDLKPGQQEVVDFLSKHIVGEVGLTQIGNRLTVRAYFKGHLVDMHMIIVDVTTLADIQEERDKDDRYSQLFAEMPKEKADRLKHDLYFAENGEYLK